MKYTFDSIRKNGLLLYEYIRGSQAFGTNLPTSDEDHGGVFRMAYDDVLGLDANKVRQVQSEKNDDDWDEIEKYMELLSQSSPFALESLFVPERCILYIHPDFVPIYENRNEFLTKDAFDTFCKYAKAQMERARGLNKKIVNPIERKKTVLEFCYTFKGQGSEPIESFLSKNGLFAKYCGLVNIDHMPIMHGVYYDFGNHFLHEGVSSSKNCPSQLKRFINNVFNGVYSDDDALTTFIQTAKPIGYRGIIDENNETSQVRTSSIPKDEKPICYMAYNENGYQTHCKKYKEYVNWVAKRNPQRYLENKGKEFDRKNMMHATRLLNMGVELAKTGKLNIDRSNIDRDLLLNIRLGNATYDDLMKNLNDKWDELLEYAPSCPLPDTYDINKINDILLKLRKSTPCLSY